MINLKIKAIAFLKMQTLVSGFPCEVGWYGTARKLNDKTYIIDDILVYPQYASAAHIEDDIPEMQEWFNTLDNDTYNYKRFHGHSHVNFGVFASHTDKKTYEDFKKQNSAAMKNRFTISVIMNKRFEMNWRIHDAELNEEYLNDDIAVEILIDDRYSMSSFFIEAMSMVKVKDIFQNFILEGTPTKTEEDDYGYEEA